MSQVDAYPSPSTTRDYLAAVDAGVVIFDGATGTWLQQAGLGPEDFGGPELEGCNEVLNLTRPDLIAAMHRAYFEAGADVTETNTFGAFAVPLGEYGLEERAYEIAAAGAALARAAADEHGGRFVAGSLGPGTKLPSLGQIRYRDLRDAYEVEAAGLLDGGVDLVIVETQFDLLAAKAAINGARRAMRAAGREVPIQAQVTIELTGRMLPGTEIGAALTVLESLGADVIGLNCATGPAEMYEPIRYLAANSRVPVACIPNAGLPHVAGGEMVYDLGAAEMAGHLATFVEEFGVRVVGGCCGTTPEYVAEIAARCRPLRPAARRAEPAAAATSIYSPVPFAQDASFLIIGERTNANGSKAFRKALLEGDLDRCVAIAQDQVAESAHLVDLCVDYVGRDGAADMDVLAARFATEVAAPVVLDSTEPPVMQAGLERFGGRCVLNSANLEDGDGPGSRAARVFELAREHGAAVICLLIDEEGQARDADWKLRVAKRLYHLATEEHGLAPGDLMFDALTFPLTTGGEDLRRDAMETMEAIRRIKAEFPGAYTVLGVSNVSFGLKPAARRVLNSVFLHECVEAGLDAAIVHAAKILPLNQIDPELLEVCLDLVHDRRRPGYDPLEALLAATADLAAATVEKEDRSGWPVERRLEQRIVDGDRHGLGEDLDAAMAAGHPALDIVNRFLLAGMKTVGDLFASGDMQLPFVLKSAETMKAAVRHLEPHMERSGRSGRGSIVLATVKGDVHDIGKNLVDIILTNNGFEVHNLGIKIGINEMIEKYHDVGADAIGMSGLLVKSTLIMRDNLEELERRGLGSVPVLLGGAALTRSYVEEDLRSRYPGPLFYGKDAFAGLDAMQHISEGEPPPEARPRFPRRAAPAAMDAGPAPARSPDVKPDNRVFEPPFLGARVVKGIAVADVAAYLNETALFRNQWGYRPENGEDDAAFKDRVRAVLRRELARAQAADLLVPQVVYGYFPVNADGDELIVWHGTDRRRERTRFGFPRQHGEPWLCIADFFRPASGEEVDYAGFHIVTMGSRASERAAELFAADRYHDYLLVHGLGVEMAEALAELWHHRIREEWGFAAEDGPTLGGLFRQQYRGGRYSWGYPACPDLEDNARVAELLDAGRLGIEVGPETGYQYHPEQTTSAIICHHPQAKYFIARSGRQVRSGSC